MLVLKEYGVVHRTELLKHFNVSEDTKSLSHKKLDHALLKLAIAGKIVLFQDGKFDLVYLAELYQQKEDGSLQ